MRPSGWLSLLAAAALLMVGCGSQVPGASAPPAVGDASRVDMCTVLTDAELSGLGIDLSTRQQVDELGTVGCQWVGKPIRLSLERDRDTIAKYAKRRNDPAFTSFHRNLVNGRAGIQFSVSDAGDQCVQLMDGGPASLTVAVGAASSLGPPVDPCAQALRIAEMIEPRLPKVGK